MDNTQYDSLVYIACLVVFVIISEDQSILLILSPMAILFSDIYYAQDFARKYNICSKLSYIASYLIVT